MEMFSISSNEKQFEVTRQLFKKTEDRLLETEEQIVETKEELVTTKVPIETEERFEKPFQANIIELKIQWE